MSISVIVISRSIFLVLLGQQSKSLRSEEEPQDSIYRTIDAAKIRCDTISSKLRKEGFDKNAHDMCAFNAV